LRRAPHHFVQEEPTLTDIMPGDGFAADPDKAYTGSLSANPYPDRVSEHGQSVQPERHCRPSLARQCSLLIRLIPLTRRMRTDR
jgi:hypothetical protein